MRLRALRLDQVLYCAAVVLLAAAPMIRGWRFVHDDVVLIMPDLNETWLSTMAAADLDQSVGPWSRIGLFHLGPMWFYWCAPFLALAGGQPAGLFLGALALVSACSVVTVEQVRRSLGISAGLVAAVTIAFALVLLDPTGVAFPWNPTVLILPTVAALVSAARAAATRSVASACLGIVLSWFVVQTHLGALPLGASLLVASTVFAARALHGEWMPRLGWTIVAVLCVALPVVPIARDQIVGTQNATAVARYVTTGRVSPRFPEDPPSPSPKLGTGTVLRESASITTLIQGDVARWAGADLLLARDHEPSTIAPAVLLALLATSASAAMRLQRSRRSGQRSEFLGWLGLVACTAVIIQTIVAIRARGEFRPYLIAASAGVGIVLWLAAALQARQVLVDQAQQLSISARRILEICTAALLLIPLGMFLQPPLEGIPLQLESSNQASKEIAARLGTRHVRVRADRIGTMAATQRLVAGLERDGMIVTVDGREIAHFSDHQRRHDNAAVEINLVPVDPAEPMAAAPLTMVEGFAVIRT